MRDRLHYHSVTHTVALSGGLFCMDSVQSSFSVLIFGMATLLLFGIASTKEEEFSTFIKRISTPKEQTPPSDEIVNPPEKILIKPKEEIQLPGEENTGTTAL